MTGPKRLECNTATEKATLSGPKHICQKQQSRLSWWLSRDVVESQLLGRGVRRGNSTRNHALSGCARLIRLLSRCLLKQRRQGTTLQHLRDLPGVAQRQKMGFDGSPYKDLRRHAFFRSCSNSSAPHARRDLDLGDVVFGQLAPFEGSLELQSRLWQAVCGTKRRLAASFARALHHVVRPPSC